MDDLIESLSLALAARTDLLEGRPDSAFRLFAGFYEGCRDLVVDLYGRTLVIFDYSESFKMGEETLAAVQDFYLNKIHGINCVIWKPRTATDLKLRRGTVTVGDSPANVLTEHGVHYAIDLLMNQDASFYLDTRNLREWLLKNARGWQVLNTFAYTGSLGVAALAGGAERVLQTDRNKQFLTLARQSGMRSRLDIGKMKLQAADFFSQVARLKREKELFDCVIVDPPFFSSTTKGRVDLVNESVRVINKVRPLIKHGGYLVSINNALFLSGAEYVANLEELCQDGYLFIEQTIPIPEDITGYPASILNLPPVDPAPFNHSTKIVILKVKRKD